MVINKSVVIFAITSLLLAILFITNPQIDLVITGLFYNDGFFMQKMLWPNLLHNMVKYICIVFALFFIVNLIFSYLGRKTILTKAQSIYLILALIIGPGLVVNTIFKDNWGRARPSQTTNFGGDKIFTPAFIKTDQCERNCSFVSGDPSVLFFIFALALIFPKYKNRIIFASMSLGLVFGTARIVLGAHFASDVIFSAVFTMAVSYILFQIFKKKSLL